ncbi:zinc dependent phospholipase C family protein [Clostridium estertheticum]|uniref:zinc dependent phospholipase C family protein n=1 Tax=Clostridium estertheticum TaxID=238834 RepID=UPI0013EE75F6|nr:zinc dependent phospholipase C family protein [Clostridium estertheticum]MBZ9609556.1 zinc dependent phospholipase C family protein [Clostridium estertheticum]
MKANKKHLLILVATCIFTFTLIGTSTFDVKASETKKTAINQSKISELNVKLDLLRSIASGSDKIVGQGAPYDGESNSKTANFISGGINHTHQFLVSNAINCIINDKNQSIASTLIANESQILNFSDMPDNDEITFIPYAPHFYDPNTGKNYANGRDTALSRFLSHASNAVNSYSIDKTHSYEELGRACHFLADLNEPHHTANVIASPFSTHTSYEKWADKNRAKFIISNGHDYTAWTDSDFQTDCTHNAIRDAKESRQYISIVNDAKGSWNEPTSEIFQNAQSDIAGFLYRFLKEVGEI